MKLCLASGSQSRKKVLERASMNYVVHPSQVEEIHKGETPEMYVKRLSYQKADDVAKDAEESIVIGADSVVVLEGEIIEKPKDREDAIDILAKLHGRTHIFLTGLTVIDKNQSKVITRCERTQVTFTSLSKDMMQRYVDRFNPYTFAGGYDNGISSWFIKSIQGSQSNLMGLPMTLLREILEDLGHEFFDFVRDP